MARKSHKSLHNRGIHKRRPDAKIRCRKAARKIAEYRMFGGPLHIRIIVPMSRMEKRSIRRLIDSSGGLRWVADQIVRETASKRAQGTPSDFQRRTR